MRITNLDVRQFLGVSSVAMSPHEAIVLVAGDNGVGKTTLYQAIRLALFDELPRVDLKRDAGALVRDGAKSGSVQVDVLMLDGADPAPFAVQLPGRQRSGTLDVAPDTRAALSGCLDPAEFAWMENADRAKLLLALSGVRMDRETIAKRLAARGIAASVVTAVEPILGLGFERAAAHAREKAAEARGEWKALTGETYGSNKAEGWAPPDLPALPEPPASMAEAIAKHTGVSGILADLRNRRREFEAAAVRATKDRELAPTVPDLQKAIAALDPVADAGIERSYLACPDCGAKLELVEGAGLVKFQVPAKGTVKPAVRSKAVAERNTLRTRLQAAQASAARLAEPSDAIANVSDADIAAAEDKLATTTDLMHGISAEQERYATAVQAHRAAGARKANADAAHQLVVGWSATEQALAPGGIPSESMKEALAPFRGALASVSSGDTVSLWPAPAIGDDASISAWGRPFALLSESEQFRVSAMLAVAIGSVAGIRILAMDRFDVLAPRVRGEFLDWLRDMVDDHYIEQAWLFCTLKGRPNDADMVDARWLENGVLA